MLRNFWINGRFWPDNGKSNTCIFKPMCLRYIVFPLRFGTKRSIIPKFPHYALNVHNGGLHQRHKKHVFDFNKEIEKSLKILILILLAVLLKIDVNVTWYVHTDTSKEKS